jgi:eukaryotic-like serine/threonine-protein kinase
MSTGEHDAAEEFGPYLVYERLGMGGMATVHRAKKRGIAGFERGVALKRLLPHLAEDQEFIQSFVREAKLASLLVHPNIAQIYDLGRIGSAYYIAMEHVDGIDVRKILRYARKSGEVIPLPVALSIIAELCDALEYAHTFVDELGEHLGIVHRDVSPSNLILSNSGHLKVIDFGIAKATSKQHHTESGRVKGKLGYLSPEAAVGKSYGPPSDVFSAGVVAFELLTTRPLFWAKNDYETLLKIHHAEVPPPSRLNPAVPPDLDKVILAALARSGSDRTQSAGDLRIGIDRIASRFGFRLSSREVFDWISGGISESWATLRTPPRSLSQQQQAASAAQLRPLPLPPPPEPQLTTRSTSGGRSTSIAHAAALAESGLSPTVGSGVLPLPRSAEEDLIAELAWGSDGQSYPLIDLPCSGAATPGPRPGPSSAAIPVARLPGGLRRWAVPAGVAGALILAAAGAVFLRAPTAGSAPAPARATLNFKVQPSDSVISIGGTEVSQRTPYRTELDPGVYSIIIRRPGYQTWTQDITLRAGDTQAVGVELQAASEVGASAPPPRTAPPEGEPVERGDEPSRRDPSARAPGEEPARSPHDRPPLRRDIGLSPDEAPAASGRRDRPGGEGDRSIDPVHEPAGSAASGARPDGVDAPALGHGPSVGPSAGPVATATPPATAPIATPVAAAPVALAPGGVPVPAAPARVPTVAATAVTKLSGSMPPLHMRGGGKELGDGDVLAKLCIDEQGRVFSVEVVRSAPQIAAEVARALRGWRYKP